MTKTKTKTMIQDHGFGLGHVSTKMEKTMGKSFPPRHDQDQDQDQDIDHDRDH